MARFHRNVGDTRQAFQVEISGCKGRPGRVKLHEGGDLGRG